MKIPLLPHRQTAAQPRLGEEQHNAFILKTVSNLDKVPTSCGCSALNRLQLAAAFTTLEPLVGEGYQEGEFFASHPTDHDKPISVPETI